MPWMVQSKGRLLHLRDGDGPLYVIDDRREYPLEHLPGGVRPEPDSAAFYRRVDSVDGVPKAMTYAETLELEKLAREENTAAAAKAAADAAPPEAAPRRKSRVRSG